MKLSFILVMQLTQLEQRCMGHIPTVTGGAFLEPVDKVVRELKAKGAPAKFIKEIIDDAKKQEEASKAFAAYKGPIGKAKLISGEMIAPLSLEDALVTLLHCGFNLNAHYSPNKQVKIGFDSKNGKYMPAPYVVGPIDGKRLIWTPSKRELHSSRMPLNKTTTELVSLKTAMKELYHGVTRVLVYPANATTPALGYAFHMHTTEGRMPDLKYRRFHI